MEKMSDRGLSEMGKRLDTMEGMVSTILEKLNSTAQEGTEHISKSHSELDDDNERPLEDDFEEAGSCAPPQLLPDELRVEREQEPSIPVPKPKILQQGKKSVKG